MAKAKTDKGTHYMPRETEQRSYFLPPGLGDAFKNFCNGNASTGCRGAFVAFMALVDFPHLREEAIRAAQNMTIPEAVEKIKGMLLEEVGVHAIQEWARSLPEAERAKLLAEARRRGVR